MLYLLAALLLIPFFAYDAIVGGFVFSVLWRWFIMPIFPSLDPIGVLPAAGIMLFFSLFTGKGHKDEDTALVSMLIGPWLALGAGWVLLQFIN